MTGQYLLALEVHQFLHRGGGRLKKGKNDGLFREVSKGGLHFQTQNPNKDSPDAVLARQGHRITWIKSGGRYIGKVLDGRVQWFR